MADLTVTAASVLAAEGATILSGTAGATITAGQVIYKDTSDSNKMKLCDSDGGTAIIRTPAGIALHGADSGQPIDYCTEGDINVGATLAVGRIYVASDTAGGIMPSADLEAGDYTSVLGVATTASNLKMKLIIGGVAYA